MLVVWAKVYLMLSRVACPKGASMAKCSGAVVVISGFSKETNDRVLEGLGLGEQTMLPEILDRPTSCIEIGNAFLKAFAM